MKYFDLHCDTALAIAFKNHSLYSNSDHVSIEKARMFKKYVQSFAFFALKKLSDEEAFEAFNKMYDAVTKQAEEFSDDVVIVKNAEEYKLAEENGKMIILPAIEDARILAGNLARLDDIKKKGIWYLTLLWGGDTIIGGSHNTENGLTDFGNSVVRRCFELGIVPDISHASELSAEQTLEIASEVKKPIIASHSNSYTVYSHSRNLRDRHLNTLMELGGIVGISLCDAHIADKDPSTTCIDDLVKHVEYYMSRGAQDALCIGADWDGTSLPCDMYDIRDAGNLYEKLLSINYNEDSLKKIFYENARRFYLNNL